uniref:sensor histidine kinase n=2 Tax=Azorhizobium caulinodans TaxID=7 RepID=UPI002FBDD864
SLALSTERHAILVNNIQLQQVLFNLITNAVQAMANAATPERHLRISTATVEDNVEVTIEDTGCGMSQEVIARIFQPFFTTKTTGMGVGLAICRSIMERHGGTLEARSIEGKGSTFFVRIPLAPP